MRFDRDWLRSRRRFLGQVKEQVRRRLGPESRALRTYVGEYELEFRDSWLVSGEGSLVEAVKRARLVLGADFHAFPQSQRIHLRVLRQLPESSQVVLGLEAIATQYQEALDAFMADELLVEEFLKAVRWSESWGFPWENYSPLIELAKARKFRVVALDKRDVPSGLRGLRLRDDHVAKVIQRELQAGNGITVYAIVGDLHLARSHLPARIFARSIRLKRREVVTVLQNSEHLYFRLARKKLEDRVEVMRSGLQRFCVLSSPPWVKWQSYLMHLESYDDQGFEDDVVELTDQVAQYVRILARDFRVEVPVEHLEVFTLDQRRQWGSFQKRLEPRHRRLVRNLMTRERSFGVLEAGVMFLSRKSVNHAAHLAASYVHFHLAKIDRSPWDYPVDFEASIWCEAISFCLSKLINHRRKSESIESLRTQLEVTRSGSLQKEILLLALGQRLRELAPAKHRRSAAVKRRRPADEVYFESSRILGGMLGERLYRSLRRGGLTSKELMGLMSTNVFVPGFHETYARLVQRMDREQF